MSESSNYYRENTVRRAKERKLSGRTSASEQRLELDEGVSQEETWRRAFQAEGTASAKALRLECAYCVWRTVRRPLWLEGGVSEGCEREEMRVGK